MAAPDVITVKSKCQGDTRRFQIGANATFNELRDNVQAIYRRSGIVRLSFVDDDGDSCNVTNDAEMTEALRFAQQQAPPVLKIDVNFVGESSVDPRETAPSTTTTTAAVNELAPPIAPVLHEGIRCDACQEFIAGVRYKCGHCADYDLCERCEGIASHDSDHIFIKVTFPYHFPSGPLLPICYEDDAVLAPLAAAAAAVDEVLSLRPNGGFSFGDLIFGRRQRDDRREEERSVRGGGHWGRGRGCRGRGFGAVGAPRDFDRGTPQKKDKFNCAFVSDLTVTDGTTCTPGESIVKVWQIRNSGNIRYEHGTHLKFVGGDLMEGRCTELVESALPGDVLAVAVNAVAPAAPGRYVSFWRLADNQGKCFGTRLWIDIMVTASSAPVAPGLL